MATKEEILTALRNADAAGDTEAATRLAKLASEYQEPAQETQAMAFANKSIAETLGAPVDIIAGGLSKLTGGRVPADSFGGSESIRRGMAKIGAYTPDREPETFGEYVSAGVGEAAGAMLPIAAVSKRYQAAKGIRGQLASGFNRELVEKPGRVIAAELAAGAGAGVGRDIADINEFGTTGRFASEMAGGLAPSAIAMTPSALLARGLKKGAEKIGEKAFIPFTNAGGEARAARRVQELAGDIPAARSEIDEFAMEGLSPAAASGQTGLLELEDAVLRGDPARRQKMSARTEESIQKLVGAIEGEGSVGSARKLIQQRKDRVLATLDSHVESAADNASARLQELGDISPEDATTVVRQSLVDALDRAKVEEARLWERIPQETKAPVRNTVTKYRSLKSDLARAQRDDMPTVAKDVIENSRGVKKTTIRELDGLYKALGEEATRARAAKEFNKARIAEELRESILDDIANADGGPAIQEAIGTARAFSRELNEKFRKGPTGKILGYGREGGAAMEPSLAMEKTIGVGGQTGEVARRSIARAVQDDPTALEGMQNYIKSMFMRNAVTDGVVDPARAATFMRRNTELLEAFPGLSAQLKAAKSAEDVSRRVTKRADFFRRALDKPAVSKTAMILNSRPGDEVARILKSDNPRESMSAVMRSIRKDKTGEALKGLKNGVGVHLMESISTPSSNVLNGKKLQSMLRNENVSGALRQVYSESEFNRLKKMADTLAKFQTQISGKREVIPVLTDRPAWLLDKVAQVAGAKLGAKFSGTTGGSIQSASIGSTTARQFLGKLTADRANQILSDAIEDPELFKVLLEYRPLRKGRAVSQNQKYAKTLQAWMVGPGSRLFESEQEE